MSEMVDRVARALIDADPTMAGHHETHIAIKRPYAIAAIAAMREPRPDMMTDGLQKRMAGVAMSKSSPIQATFSDFKLIKSRKTAQLILEVPLEQADDALRALGGLPQMASERWCAIVLLDLSKASAAPKERRRMNELPIVQQAGILCSDKAFWTFLSERHHWKPADQEDAATWLREHCEIASRRELETAPNAAAKFRELQGEFDMWKRVPV